MRLSLCFICAGPLVSSTENSSIILSELLNTTCKLLEKGDISEEEWQLMETPSVTVCCASCLDCLQKIKQVSDLLQQLQERLKRCLEKLGSTVEESFKIQNADVSKWSRGFFKFRRHLASKRKVIIGNGNDPEKETLPEANLTQAFYDDQHHVETDTISGDYYLHPDIVVKTESVARKKRKIVVIAEEDEPGSKDLTKFEMVLESPSEDRTLCEKTYVHSEEEKTDSQAPLKIKNGGHKLLQRDFIPHSTKRRKEKKRKVTKSTTKKIVEDALSDDYASGSSSSWKNVSMKPKRKRKLKSLSEHLSAPDTGIFIPGVSTGKWFICGINGCTAEHNSKRVWMSHSSKEHPDADLKQVWKEMPTREIAPRRLLHCGHSLCPKFKDMQTLAKHMKEIHPNPDGPPVPPPPKPLKTWHCDICREPVPTEEIVQHVRSHVGDYAIKCPNPNCLYAFCTINNYKAHMAPRVGCKMFIGDGPNLDVCELCGYQGQGLRMHMEVVHETGTSKPFSCPVTGCSEVFTHRQTVRFHISLRHSALKKPKLVASPNSQVCPECSTSFPHDEIIRHFTDFHKVPMESVVSCQYCPYKSLSKELLIDHFLVHFRGGVTVSCDICTEDPIRFSRLGDLRRHYLEVHQIGKAFVCEYCSKKFTGNYTLKEHILRSHSDNPKSKSSTVRKFTCDLCVVENPVKYHQAGLQRHKILEHGAEPYKCPSCPKTFTSWATLMLHKKSHKNVTRPTYACDIPGCGFVCIAPVLLARHKASIRHSGRTNAFLCEECGAGFNRESHRNSHQRQQHAQVKEFVCDVCGRGFITQLLLTNHVRSHTGERPFECSICDNRYADKSHLRRHMKTHRPNAT